MDSVSFVVYNYQAGVFDGRKAYSKIVGKRRSVAIPWLVAAAAAIVLCVFLFNGYRNARKEYRAYDVAQTFTLPDGSSATLFPRAALSLQPHRNPRAVEMSGTVRFAVVKDSAHPFTVAAKNSFVEVLGTIFTIDDVRPEVSVEEGLVRFSASPGSDGIMLSGGESAIIKNGVPERTTTLVFDDARLEDVLGQLRHVFSVTLACETAGKRLTAEFRSEPLEDILLLIEEALDVKIKVVSGRE